MSDPRHRAWDEIHDLLPAGWQARPGSWDPDRRKWTMAAHARRKHGRSRRPPATIWVEGEDELTALTELVLALRELDRAGRMAELEKRAHLAD